MIDPTKAREAKASRARELAMHVVACANFHGIDVEEHTGGGRAVPSQRAIRIRPVTGMTSYYVALHEIGHLIGRGRAAPKLEREANAWQWALDNAKFPPTPGVRRGIERRLRSYLRRHARMALRRRVRWPEPSHVFWTLANATPTWSKGTGAPTRIVLHDYPLETITLA
jgi:hypothetical protein